MSALWFSTSEIVPLTVSNVRDRIHPRLTSPQRYKTTADQFILDARQRNLATVRREIAERLSFIHDVADHASSWRVRRLRSCAYDFIDVHEPAQDVCARRASHI